MNKQFNTALIIILQLFCLVASAKIFENKIVYGIDNRVETYNATLMEQKLAKSTAALFSNKKLIDLDTHVMVNPTSISKSIGLCKTERFHTQKNPAKCSGFLVGQDILVTAGHCITSQAQCDNTTMIFEFKVNKKSGRADTTFPKSNVFKCSKVLESKVATGRDYAVIKLDRVVKGGVPLKYRTSGKISDNAKLTVVGHPSGLPQKIANGGKVVNNQFKSYFKTNLDTFGGNSGSAVFNSELNIVEGILVRGAKDYDSVDCGKVVHRAPENIIGNRTYGESVSRITDVPLLNVSIIFTK